MIFNLKDFIMDTLKGMIGYYPDFQIQEFALDWYAKGKLTEKDLEELNILLHPVITEEIVDENMAVEPVDENMAIKPAFN